MDHRAAHDARGFIGHIRGQLRTTIPPGVPLSCCYAIVSELQSAAEALDEGDESRTACHLEAAASITRDLATASATEAEEGASA